MNSQFFSGKHSSGRVFPVNGVPRSLNHRETVEKLKVCKAERQKNRERNAAAIIIQSVYRSFRTRRNLKVQFRLAFDEDLVSRSSSNPATASEYSRVVLQMRCIPVFYNEKLDAKRMKLLGNLLLKFAEQIKSNMETNKKFLMQVIQFLVISLKDLMYNSENNSSNLRLLQEFGKSRSTITDVIIKRSKLYKISYYNCLHKLMMCQITYELMSTFLDFIVATIISSEDQDDGINYLFNEMLGGCFNEQTSEFHQQLLKLLCNHNSRHLLLPKILSSNQITKSLSSFHAILSVFEASFDSIPSDLMLPYVSMLSEMSDVLPQPREDDSDSDSDDSDSDADDSDAGEPMETGPRTAVHCSKNKLYFKKSELAAMHQQCLDKLASEKILSVVADHISRAQGVHLYSLVKLVVVLLVGKRINLMRRDIFDVFNSDFMRRLWSLVSDNSIAVSSGLQGTTTTCFLNRKWMAGEETGDRSRGEGRRLMEPLNLFCQMYRNLLFTMKREEMFSNETIGRMHFTLDEIVTMVTDLLDIGLAIASRIALKSDANGGQHEHYGETFEHLCKLIRHFYVLDRKKRFYQSCSWIRINEKDYNFSNLKYEYFSNEINPPCEEKKLLIILKEFPFLITFSDRIQIFDHVLTSHREISQMDVVANIRFDIQRNYIYEDTFSKFTIDNVPNPHKRIRIHMYSNLGLEEIGIDGGGVFQEFCESVMLSAFDVNRGLFKYTSDHMLFPSPEAPTLYPDFRDHFFFIGRFIAKTIYDGMLLSLPLAHFFVSKILTNNHLDIEHLALLDPPFYKNLTELSKQEDIASLCLFFTVDESNVGVNEVIELKPGGKDIPVTKENVIMYIHLMADYHLNIKIKKQCDAFKRGFSNCVPLILVKMFNASELMMVFGGDLKRINVDDLELHTKYNGPLNPEHPVVKLFWQVVRSFDDEKLRLLLRFVTSSPRAPLLGFKELEPPFMIQSGGDENRLPTSSTCMHILKLPNILDYDLMVSKLTYAINSESGFELS